MSLTRSQKIDLLREIYDSLPTVDCQGYCYTTCGPIDMSELERSRIREVGFDIPLSFQEWRELWAKNVKGIHCPALNSRTALCQAYELRPLVCRAYGIGRGPMGCQWGCQVTGTRLKTHEVRALLFLTFEIGGWPPRLLEGVMTAGLPQEVLDLRLRMAEGDREAALAFTRAAEAYPSIWRANMEASVVQTLDSNREAPSAWVPEGASRWVRRVARRG